MSNKSTLGVTLEVTPAPGQSLDEARSVAQAKLKEILGCGAGEFHFPEAGPRYGAGVSVKIVDVSEISYDFDTAARILDMHPAFLMGYLERGDELTALPGTTGDQYRISHTVLVDFLERRKAARKIVDEALSGPKATPLKLTPEELAELDDL